MRDFLSLVSSSSLSSAWQKNLWPLKQKDDASQTVALPLTQRLKRGSMLKKHFLLEKPLQRSVEEV